jgi:hypothetical protein
MALFDTTKQQSIYPGLNPTQGVVDRSGLIDDSSLTTLVGLGQMGLESVIQMDQEAVLNESNRVANELADEYLSGSPSEQAYLNAQKTVLEGQAASAPDDAKDAIMKQLDDVTAKLAKGQAQGVMGQYEFQRRAVQIGQDLAAQNPAYADEISANINKVLNRRGVTDVMQADMKLMAANQKRMEDQYSHMIDTVSDYVVDPYALSEQQLLMKFMEIKQADVATNTINRLLENREMRDNMSSSEFYQQFQAVGPAQYRASVFNTVTNQVKAVLRDPNLKTYQDRVEAGRAVIETARSQYADLINRLPQDKETVKTFIRQTDALFTSLEAQIQDDFSLEGIKKYTANKEQIYKNEISIDTYQKYGTTLEAEELIQAKISTYNALKGAKLISTDQEKALLSLTSKLINSQTQGFTPSELDEVQDPAYTKMVASNIGKLNPNSPEGELDFTSTYLELVNIKDMNEEAAKKLKDYDVLMLSISNTADESFNSMYNNDKMQSALTVSMDQFKKLTYERLRRLTEGRNVDASIDEVTGLVASQDPTLEQDLKRVNIYAKLKAKILGKKVKDIIDDVVNKDFDGLGANDAN